ncbi:hypothetical protein UFOVP995_44 [uncultured Caudovirales phage]|uniref:Uncharacterized protein n=1 Tax=uncultured Caudovirales phage TaxID=2100421 RepID=A0A6J5PXP1_9CAUD|nr:hypothetical protein UFOVP995_44 [uncultured Caudovirales phage]
MDYMLRTTTESEMEDALIAAGVAQEATDHEGEVIVIPTAGISIDHIGAIPPKTDIDGNILSAGDTRWHTNIRVTFEMTPEQVLMLPTFAPEPSIPYRVFA